MQYRAWLRKTLNQNTMRYSLATLTSTKSLMTRCYQPYAVLLDADSVSDMLELLGQLDHVHFDSVVDDRA